MALFKFYHQLIYFAGEALYDIITTALENYGLNLDRLRGLGFDGGSNMAGHFEGLHGRIVAQYPTAIYVHCFSHRLNLIVKKSITSQAVRNLYMILQDLAKFFNTAKRRLVLKQHLGDDPLPRPMSETRWTDVYNLAHRVLLSFPKIISALTDFITTPSRTVDKETRQHAINLKKSMLSHHFVYILIVSFSLF